MEKDKVLTEIREAIELNRTVKQKNNDALSHAEYLLKNDEEYNRGLNDAWELAKQILYGIDKQIIEIFDVKVDPVFFDLTHKREIINRHIPQEARAMIDEWKESKEIKVGDVVSHDGLKGVVTRVADDCIYTISFVGTTPKYTASDIKKLTKTGKHIDISAILAEIGKE